MIDRTSHAEIIKDATHHYSNDGVLRSSMAVIWTFLKA